MHLWSPGFNPMWEETLVFTVHMPEIALVRFLVWDHDPIGRDFIGQRTLAFSSMMPGEQRATPLKNHHSPEMGQDSLWGGERCVCVEGASWRRLPCSESVWAQAESPLP